MGGPLGIYLGELVIGTDSKDFGVGTGTVSLTAGKVYLYGSGGSDTQLLEAIQAQIRTLPGQANAVCNYSPVSDRVEWHLNTAANVTFDDVALGNMMGFQNGSAQPSATVHTASGHPRYVWRPTRAVSDVPVDATKVWQPRSTTVSSRSVDGTTYTVPGCTLYDSFAQYRCLDKSEAITPATGSVYLDFQQWFEDIPAAGRQFRYVMNRQQYAAAADYVTAIWGADGDEEVGAFDGTSKRKMAAYQGLWDVRVSMLKKV